MKYSIVIPTYKSARFIEQTLNSLFHFIEQEGLDAEVILIDDGSEDDTWSVLQELKSSWDFVAVRLAKNFGQHSATICGFEKAQGEYIITLDDDLQFDPKNITDLIQKQEETQTDVVYGRHENLSRGFVRKIFYYVYRFIARLAEGKDKVGGSSFRLIKKKVAMLVVGNASEFTFVDELILWNTSRIAQVEVPHYEGVRQGSNYSVFDLTRLFAGVMMASSMIHIRLVKVVGLTFASGSILYSAFVLFRQLFLKGYKVQGYASTIILITFSVGIILYSLAIIGEYLAKIFRTVHKAPVYRIDEEL